LPREYPRKDPSLFTHRLCEKLRTHNFVAILCKHRLYESRHSRVTGCGSLAKTKLYR
jgi:hypothetical protein